MNAEANELCKTDPNYSTRDLFDNVAKGNFPSWTWYIQAMPEKDAEKYKYDILDVTKVISKKDYPLIPVGKMTLNRNPDNYFAEVE